jgi:hypothetical protein
MARQLGCDYSVEDPFGILGEPFALFQRGHGRGIENVIWGRWHELELKVFDYWYYEDSVDSRGHSLTTSSTSE